MYGLDGCSIGNLEGVWYKGGEYCLYVFVRVRFNFSWYVILFYFFDDVVIYFVIELIGGLIWWFFFYVVYFIVL